MMNEVKMYFNNSLYRILGVAVVLFVVGIMILFLSREVTKDVKEAVEVRGDLVEKSVDDANLQYEKIIENRLKEVLGNIQGVGKVEVMVTLKNRGEVVLEKDQPTNRSYTKEKNEDGYEKELNEEVFDANTVIISQGSVEEPIVVEEITPTIRGVLIIAEGAGNVEIKNNLINAAKVLLDLPANKIEVLKMK